jgi:hypothetical protein
LEDSVVSSASTRLSAAAAGPSSWSAATEVGPPSSDDVAGDHGACGLVLEPSWTL